MKIILLLSILLGILFSNETQFINYKPDYKIHSSTSDFYRLVYQSKSQKCTLYKNDVKIDLFDSRFDVPKPHTLYTCDAWQKEPYISCITHSQKRVSALMLSYGVYGKTNFLLGIQASNPHFNSEVIVECSKQKYLF